MFAARSPETITVARHTRSADELSDQSGEAPHGMMFETFDEYDAFNAGTIMLVRDCTKVIVRMMTRRSEDKEKFSVAGAILDIIAPGRSRPDRKPAFFADLHHLFLGLQGRRPGKAFTDLHLALIKLKNRKAAVAEILFRSIRSAADCMNYIPGKKISRTR